MEVKGVIDKERLIKIAAHPYSIATAFFLFFVAIYLHFYYQSASSQLKEANRYYLEGERSLEIATRRAAYNKALSSLLQIEEKYKPRFGNGVLYYDIGNTFFQLEEYPMALLYYYKSHSLRPFDKSVQNNLEIALKKLNLPPPPESTPIEKNFLFHTLLPLPTRLQLFFFTAVASLTLLSAYLLQPSRKKEILAAVCAFFALLFLLSLAIAHFFENPQAIVVKATNLYRGAGSQFAPVTESPLKPGTKVAAREIDEKNGWIKVVSDDGEVGYVPIGSLRLIFP